MAEFDLFLLRVVFIVKKLIYKMTKSSDERWILEKYEVGSPNTY